MNPKIRHLDALVASDSLAKCGLRFASLSTLQTLILENGSN